MTADVRTVSDITRKPNIRDSAEKMNMSQKLNRQPNRVSTIHPPTMGPITGPKYGAVE